MSARNKAVGVSLRWVDAGLCHTEEHSWMPRTDDLYAADRTMTTRMREICEGCPARFDCLTYAVATEVSSGFWAGSWYDQHHPDDTWTGDQRWVQDSIPGLGLMGFGHIEPPIPQVDGHDDGTAAA